jgi:hypothetical protein
MKIAPIIDAPESRPDAWLSPKRFPSPPTPLPQAGEGSTD